MRTIGNVLARFSTRWVPDAFVFAIVLSLLVYLLALGLTPSGPVQLVNHWYTGFWGLLEFAMQMALVLVTGYALASSPPAKRGIGWIASRPRGPRSAYALTAFCAGLLGMVHWGLGLIAGALLAVEIGRSCRERGITVHFPLLAAAGYTGLMLWHSGLSGSSPLLVNTPGHFLEDEVGLIPLSETIFQPFNLVFLAVMLIAAPLLFMSMHPRGEESEPIAAEAPEEDASPAERTDAAARTPAQYLMHSRIPVLLVLLAGLVYLVPVLLRDGIVGLDLNLLNFAFLVVGMAMHGSLAGYAASAAEGAKSASSVLIQFPFYAGIMGIMEHSGLLEIISQWFVSFSTPFSYPFWALMSAALVNLAVPSGGGQWAVQGPIVMDSTQALGIDPGIGVMAVAMGDQLTNGIQPFWALPLLALTRLPAGKVLGYSAVVMIFAMVTASLCITFLS